MPFRFYNKLNVKQKKIYEASDRLPMPILENATKLAPLLPHLESALLKNDPALVCKVTQEMMRGLSIFLKVPNVVIVVKHTRPSSQRGELHGLYQRHIASGQATITLWMKTAKQKNPVAFKTFLRTFLHEVCHHLDYTFYKIPDSFHTEGFYKRESYLLRVLTQNP